MHLRALAILTACGMAASAHGQVIDWNAPVDGNWNDGANWVGGAFPNGVGMSARFNLAGTYNATITTNISIDGLELTSAGTAIVNIHGFRGLTIGADGIANDSVIVVNSNASGGNASINFTADATISGSGTISMDAATDVDDAQITNAAATTVTHATPHAISGSGIISATMTNASQITATNPAIPLRIAGVITQTPGGSIVADAGNIDLNGGSITGGTLTGMTEQVQLRSSSATLDSVNTTGQIATWGFTTLNLQGTINNTATFLINDNGSGGNALLTALADTTFTGSGAIRMQAPTDVGDAQLTSAPGMTVTNGPDHTIHGSGIISATVANNGIIAGDDPARELRITGTITQSPSAVTGATANGTLALNNGTIVGGILSTTSGGTITTSGGTSTLDGVTAVSNSTLGIKGFHVVELASGGMTNNGTFTINDNASGGNAILRAAASCTVDGSGSIKLGPATSDLADAQLETAAGAVLTNAGSHTIRGTGLIEGDLVNDATIIADQPGLELRLTGTIAQGPTGITGADQGIMGLGSGASLTGGTTATTNGGIVEATTGISSIGSLTNTGDMGIRSFATMQAIGDVTNNGTLQINTDAGGGNAILLAMVPVTFNGSGDIKLGPATNDLADAQLNTDAAGSLTNGPNHTIHGTGFVQNTIINNGAIVGDEPALELRITADVTQSPSGTIRGSNTGIAGLASATIIGGRFASDTGGTVSATSGTSTISGVTNTGTLGVRGFAAIALDAGGLTNNNLLHINDNANGGNATVNAITPTAITGTGTIQLGPATSDIGDAQLRTDAGMTCTLGANQTIVGRGIINGDFILRGTLAPGFAEANEINMGGSMDHRSNSTLAIEVGGTANADFDRLTGNAQHTLGGTLDVTLINAFTPAVGDSFSIITGTDIAGTFDAINAPALAGARVWKVAITPTVVDLLVTCPADLSGSADPNSPNFGQPDGILDATDFFFYLALFSAGDLAADLTGTVDPNSPDFGVPDGTLDASDFFFFLTLFAGAC